MREKRSKPLSSTSSRPSVRQKSSPPIRKVGQPDQSWWYRYRQSIGFGCLYFFIVLAASYFFYRRFPNNYHEPNFYAEDGAVFAKALYDRGFISAITTTFNGYYLWGIYLLEQIGIIINRLIYDGEFVNLARSLALTSYLFLGFLVTLPILLFRRHLKPMTICLIVLLGLCVPMTGWDYAIIGTIGNMKFAFVYLAFLLLVYRHLLPKNSRMVLLVDFGLLICAYTNITVYAMLPFAVLRYLPYLKDRQNLLTNLRQDLTFRSIVVLGLALLPQLYILQRDGVPSIPGYLDSAYQYGRTSEIFVARTYLYAILFPINKLLNDVLVWLIFLVIAALALLFTDKNRKFVFFGLFSAFMATFLFVVKRTGISEFFTGYENGGPDQFFYPQNLIFSFIVATLVVSLVSKIKTRFTHMGIYLLIICYALFGMLPNASDYGENRAMEAAVGNIYSNSKKLCATDDQTLDLPVYPTKNFHYEDLDRRVLCTHDVLSYQPEYQKLGLAPFDNTLITDMGTRTSFTQTFKAENNNLDGLKIFFSTFLKRVSSPYTLTLFSENCLDKIASAPIPTNKIKDNSYQLITFPSQRDSQNKTYCFTIEAANQNPQPLALQLSASGLYPDGHTIINGNSTERDVVFEIHYKQ